MTKLRLWIDLRNQVSLEFVQIDIQRTIEPKGGSDRRDNLSDKPVEVREAWRCDTEVLLADVVDSHVINLYPVIINNCSPNFISYIYHERAIRVLKRRMGGQYRVVRLND